MTEHNEDKNFNADEIPFQEISDPNVISKSPLASIKMITYNHEPYIAQAIEGILMQETYFPIELIIGEDCSTDRTREIVFDYQNKYPEIIRVITSGKNVGSRKNSIRTGNVCHGKYIAFCEGDDRWIDSLKLQKQVDYLELHPECGLVHSDVDHYYVETSIKLPAYHKQKMLTSNYNNENIVNAIITYDYMIETCTAVARKDLLDEIYQTCQFEFSENFFMGDFQIWVEIAYRSKIKYMDEVLAARNMLPESASRSKSIDQGIKFLRNSRSIHMHYADKYGGKDSMELKRRIISRIDNELINIACSAFKPDLAQELLENSGKYQVPIDRIRYFHLLGSRNTAVFYLVKILVLPVRISKKVIRVILSYLKQYSKGKKDVI